MTTDKRGSMLANIIWILVICIIIAAIMYPVFSRAREAFIIFPGCQGNLKECAIAIHTYWNDYDGCLPSSAIARHSKKWNKRDFLAFATKRGELPPSVNNRRTWTEIVYDHMTNKDIMFCYADSASRDDTNALVSYWWKLAFDKAWYGEGCTKPYRKFDDFTHPEDQIVLYEHKGWHCDKTDGLKNGVQINVAFLDTHVRCITIKNATSGNPVNCAANSDGEPMYFNFDLKKQNSLPKGLPVKFVDPGRYSDAF